MRRGFAILVIVAIQACRAAPARPSAATVPHRVGILAVGFNAEVSLAAGAPRREALLAALRERGLREGENLSFVERLDDGSHPAQVMDILAKAARELVEQRVELIIAAGSTEALVAERTTTTIPIVFWSAEPIAEGLVTNLEHPGGNATGIIPRADTYTTRLEVINALLPGAGPIGFLYNPTYRPGVGTLELTRHNSCAPV